MTEWRITWDDGAHATTDDRDLAITVAELADAVSVVELGGRQRTIWERV